jgi:transcriptional regulator with XRE-family HTH domain
MGEDETMNDLGSRLKTYRTERARLTIAALASKSGVAIGTISEIENGKHDPRVGTLTRLLRAMGSKGRFKLF